MGKGYAQVEGWLGPWSQVIQLLLWIALGAGVVALLVKVGLVRRRAG
jgi:hypothetical protein